MKLLYLDPSYNSSKFRTEFRIPNNLVVYSDIEVLNVGLQKTNNGNTDYNSFGAFNIIKSIEVYDGSTLLDQVQAFDIYQSWKQISHSNADNQSNGRALTGSDLGYLNYGEYEYDANGAEVDNPKVVPFIPDYTDVIYGADATASDKKKNGKVLSLPDYLGIFKGLMYFPPNVFKDLRIVINYQSDVLDAVVDRNGTYETLEPLMSLRYEENEEMAMARMKQFSGGAYETVEHASIVLPAVNVANDTTEVQEASYFIKSFNDKYISDIVMVKTPGDATTYVNGNVTNRFSKYGSVSQCQFEVQNRYNGVTQFPNKLRGQNRSLAMLVDSVNGYNMATAQNLVQVAEGGFQNFYNNRQLGGEASYLGWRVDDLIKEWKMDISRRAIGDPAGSADANLAQRQSLILNMFGKSRKSIVPTANGYIVQYV